MRDLHDEQVGSFGFATDQEGETIIPILTDESEDNEYDDTDNLTLPILPIKNQVLFPGVVIPITVSKERSVRLVQHAYKGNRTIGIVGLKDQEKKDPAPEDMYQVGTVAKIVKQLNLPDGNITIIIQGKKKFALGEILSSEPYITAHVALLKDKKIKNKKEEKAIVQSLRDAAGKVLQLNPDIPQEAQVALDNIESTSFLTHFLASNLNEAVPEKQALLEFASIKERSTKLLQHMLKEIQLLEIKHEIHNKAHSDIDQQQRDFFLRQQMKVLQNELGDASSEQEIENLKQRADEKKWPVDTMEHFAKELTKLQRMSPQSPEYPITFSYLEFMLDLPWEEVTEDNFDLDHAQSILDSDHYGLDKVKDRIIEYLAVLKLKRDMKGPILCLYGPPGVGKTSLGRSIAKALGRQYVRMSLGGLRDEAEIRGHRKTYIGAMPGRILQSVKKSGSANPVFILDEIDKIGSDFRGDPSSAFLEILDPEQNHEFVDNYLEIEYDLSKILFIATANSLDTIQPALRDRMEIIEINGYTMEEKVEIAKKHLLPKQKEENGLKPRDLSMHDKALQTVIEGHTRESGVRNLERKLGSVVRNVAKDVAMEKEFDPKITPERIEEILGNSRFDKELYQDNETAGVVTGLAWTPVGGEILFIESSLNRGKGKLILSGQLGDVMKESATAALSYLKAHADTFGIDYRVFDHYDLHIHVPAGAVPKDGPSAGITMLTSIASIFTQRKIKAKIAMTGEITLRGKVLPVGGIKEKLLAARRAGIKEIIFSEKNQKDVSEIDEKYLKNLRIHFVDKAEEVLELALLKTQVKNPLKLEVPEPIAK